MFNKLVLAVGITMAVSLFTGTHESSLSIGGTDSIAQPEQTPVQVSRTLQNQPNSAVTRSPAKSSN